METMLAKIYTLDKNTLILEACTNRQIENVLKLATRKSPIVEIFGAENVAMSYEAKALFVEILHKAKETYDNDTSLGIRKIANNDILITWKGCNKQIINLNHLENVKIGVGLGICDEELLNLIPERSNEYLKSFKFTQTHTDSVCNHLNAQYINLENKKQTHHKLVINKREM